MFGWIYRQIGSWLEFFVPVLFRKKGTLLILGLDNAGKTSLMFRLKEGRMTQSVPTGMPTNEVLEIGKITFTTYDLGGHRTVRRVWRDYMPAADGVVFVLDAADRSRFPEAKEEIQSMLSDLDIPNIPFAVLANKIDLFEAASVTEIQKYMDFRCTTDKGKLSKADLGDRRPLEIFPCSVLCEQGYGDAFRWLSDYI